MKKKYLLLALLALGCMGNLQAQRKRVSPYAPQLEQLYNKVDAAQNPAVANKPLIGISQGYSEKKNSVNTAYVNSVLMNGGVPYIIPVTDDVEVLRQIVAQLDGIVFTGGEDFAPAYYGAEEHEKLGEVNVPRDTYDLTLFKLAKDRNVPILGIVENMSYFKCPDCGGVHKIFGESNIEMIAAKHNIPVVCKLPIDPSVAAKCDRGAAEEYEGEWLDPMIDFLEKMK